METEAFIQFEHYNEEAHYPLLADWWKLHDAKCGCPPREMLPKLGVVGLLNGEPSAMVFMFMSNSNGVAMLEYPVARTGLTLAESRKLFTEIVKMLHELAKEHGYFYIVVNTFPSIMRVLAGLGYQPSAKGLTSAVKTL